MVSADLSQDGASLFKNIGQKLLATTAIPGGGFDNGTTFVAPLSNTTLSVTGNVSVITNHCVGDRCFINTTDTSDARHIWNDSFINHTEPLDAVFHLVNVTSQTIFSDVTSLDVSLTTVWALTAAALQSIRRHRAIERTLWRIIAPFILFMGTLGNVLSGLVMSQKSMRRSVTGLYFLVLAFADTLVLYTGLLRLWLKEAYGFDMRNSSAAMCKVHSFLVYWSSDFAAWVIVIVTLERYISVVFPHKAKDMRLILYLVGLSWGNEVVTRFSAVISLIVAAAVLVVINGHLLKNSSLHQFALPGKKSITYCGLLGGTFQKTYWPWIDFATFSLVPFVLLMFCNMNILVCLVRAHYRRRHQLQLVSGSNPRMTTMTAILLLVSLTFFILTAPVAVYLIAQQTWLNTEDEEVSAAAGMWWAVVNILSYTNNAINFLLYCVSGSRFRQQLARLFCVPNRVGPLANNTAHTATTAN